MMRAYCVGRTPCNTVAQSVESLAAATAKTFTISVSGRYLFQDALPGGATEQVSTA